MPQAVVWAVAWLGAELGSAMMVMYAVEIATAAILVGGMAYSNAKASQAKQQAKDQYNAAQVDRMVNVVSTTAPRELVMGRVRKAGAISFRASTGPNSQDLYLVIDLAGHEIDAIEAIYLNDQLVTLDPAGNVLEKPYLVFSTLSGYAPNRDGIDSLWTAITDVYGHEGEPTGGITYQYPENVSNVRITKHLGAPGQTVDPDLAFAFPADWTSTSTVEGVAYLMVKLTYSETSFPSGVPNVTAVIRGAKLYDPRTGQTVWSENPALMLRHVYQHPKFGKASITAAEDARIIAAANACDQSVNYTVAGVATAKPLYRAAIVLPFGTAPKSAFDDLTQAMGGSWAFAGGALYVKPGIYSASVMSLSDADLAVVKRDGATETQVPISISVHKERAQKFNTVKVSIWDQAQDYKQVSLTPLVGAPLLARDGCELTQEVTFPAIGYAPQALHIAGVMMRDARDALVVDLPFKLRAYPLELFDTVDLTLSRYGWAAKTFMILSRTWTADGSIQLTLKETSAAITQMDSGFLPQGFAANTNLPKPWVVAGVGPLTVTPSTVTQKDSTVVSTMTVAWPQVADMAVVQAGKVEVQYRRSESVGAWASLIVPGDETQVTTSEIEDGAYYIVRARAKTTLGVGDWSAQVQTHITGKTAAPVAPTATAVGGMFQVVVAWTFGDTSIDLRGTEIWWSATNDRAAASRLSFEPFPASSYSHIGLSAGQGGYYWLRVSSTSEVLSPWFPQGATAGIYAAASADASALLTQLNDALGIDQLTAGLNSRIDLIDGGVTQPALPYPLAKIAALQDGLNQRVRLDVDAAANDLLQSVINTELNMQRISDAGIYVDATTGTVRIFGVDGANDHLNAVDIRLYAAEGNINLKASTTYVDGAIAAAVLTPADLLLFDGMDVRVTTAEADIDGLQGEILLKATVVDLSNTTGRVTTAEGEIDTLQGQIVLKVTNADFTTVTDGLNMRLGTAESSLMALGDTSAITAIVEQSSQRLRDDNADAETLLLSILNGDDAAKRDSEALAYAREDLVAHTDAGDLAEATKRLELTAQVGLNLASLLDEKEIRATADSAEAAARLALRVDMETTYGTTAAAAISASTAATKATEAGNSALSASTSANQAASSFTSAAGQAAIAANEAAASAGSATTAGSQAGAAGASALSASNSAIAAESSAGTASTKAGEAATSAVASAGSASTASTQATNAGGYATSASDSAVAAASSAGTAATKAGESAASAGASATSASGASTSATDAGSSATSANSAAVAAASSAGTAATKAGEAVASASASATSEFNAATSATNAGSFASSASGSATAASSSAGTAGTYAGQASSSATDAAASAATYASNFSTVQARLDTGDYAAVKAESATSAGTLTGLKAKNTVKLDANGYVSGTESVNDGVTSSFTVLADKFLVAKPDGTGTPIPMMSLGTVNGVTALGINGNLFIDGSINTRSITVGTATVSASSKNTYSTPNARLDGFSTAAFDTDPIGSLYSTGSPVVFTGTCNIKVTALGSATRQVYLTVSLLIDGAPAVDPDTGATVPAISTYLKTMSNAYSSGFGALVFAAATLPMVHRHTPTIGTHSYAWRISAQLTTDTGAPAYFTSPTYDDIAIQSSVVITENKV